MPVGLLTKTAQRLPTGHAASVWAEWQELGDLMMQRMAYHPRALEHEGP